MTPRYPHRLLVAAVALGTVVGAAACQADPEPEETTAERPTEPTPAPVPEQPGGEPDPTPGTPTPTPTEEPEDDTLGVYGVSAGHADAVEAGMEVLADGGNAVEAAIAAAFAISVVEPFASGVGGGGAALVAEPDEDPVAYDYRDVVALSGDVPASDIGIPGFVAGMAELHDDYGTGDFGGLLDPAITLAEHGAETSETVANQLRSGAGRLPAGQLPHFFVDGAALDEGEPLEQQELADTLARIADGGAERFYRGDLAEELADAVGAIDTDSLEAYQVERPDPVAGPFAGFDVYSSAPPLAGATLVQLLQIAEALDIGEHEPGSADYLHASAMAWRIAEEHLNADVGDPAFLDVPVDELTDPDHNADLAADASTDAVAAGGAQRTATLPAPDGNTTHITVVDADGTVVSMTNTLSNFWGSGRYALGFFLNDQLRNFGNRPGSPNEPPEPGKRTVASSSPTIVLDPDGRPVLALGSPGGRRIPNILSQVLIRWAAHGESLDDAVAAPRIHGQGGVLHVEEMPPEDVAGELRGRGYGIEVPAPPYYFGSVQALEIDHDAEEITGAADERREADWRADTP